MEYSSISHLCLLQAREYLEKASKECPAAEINSSIQLAQDEITRAIAKMAQLTGLDVLKQELDTKSQL